MANAEHIASLKKNIEDWRGWRVTNSNIQPDFSNADLRNIDLSSRDLSGANLSGTDLRGAQLRNSTFHHADLTGANLHDSNMAGIDLREANLREADLSDAYLGDESRSDAPKLKDKGVKLVFDSMLDFYYTSTTPIAAILRRANLRGANLQGSYLSRADCSHANFRNADLKNSRLSNTNLTGARLENADFTNAHFSETLFANVDLSNVEGLDMCKHLGPSPLDHRTLQKSGPLPLAFLRGCGLSDWEIGAAKIYNTSLNRDQATLMAYEMVNTRFGDAFQYHSCFISYSSTDKSFADRLHADLQAAGVRCWFAPEDIQGGKFIHEQLDQAIHMHDKLLLVLSPQSITSDWVEYELTQARERERREKKRVLFPVSIIDYDVIKEWTCFDPDEGRDLAREVRRYYIPDFTNWKDNDAYQVAFQRLLRDLKEDPSVSE